MTSINESELVVGDIVKIMEGMEIGADMMLLQAYDISIDESSLTGELDPIIKKVFNECIQPRNTQDRNIPSPILLSGTRVSICQYCLLSDCRF